MKLVPIATEPDAAVVLYDLLAERAPEESISHRAMPTWDEHCAFIASAPYDCWCLIQVPDAGLSAARDYVGAIYLTRRDEIGITIFETERQHGYASEAIRLLTKSHPRPRYLANINPRNTKSIHLFAKLGFALIQHTYELRP